MLPHSAAYLSILPIYMIGVNSLCGDYHLDLSEESNHKLRSQESEPQHLVLTSEYLHRLDGVTFLLDGGNIKIAMGFIKDLIEKQVGKLDKKTGKRMGSVSFNGHLYGIHELAKMERDFANNPVMQQQLQQALKKAKSDIMDMLRPFIGIVSMTRWIVIPILEEWIEKKPRPDTWLIKWKDCSGEEEVTFMKAIQSFQTLTRFCTDLRVFLGDLIHNCPKGYAQFEELLRQHEQHQK